MVEAKFDVRGCEGMEKKWGSGGLPPGKIFKTTPFGSLENAPAVQKCTIQMMNK